MDIRLTTAYGNTTANTLIQKGSSVASSSSFSDVLQAATTKSDYVLDTPVNARVKQLATMEFQNATGLDWHSTVDILFGNIGSNEDYRDWEAIMASSDPLQAARLATAQMYNNSSLNYATTDGTDLIPSEVTAQTVNISAVPNGPEKALNYYLTDSRGMLLTILPLQSSEKLQQLFTNYGFDTAQIADLITQLQAKSMEVPTVLLDMA